MINPCHKVGDTAQRLSEHVMVVLVAYHALVEQGTLYAGGSLNRQRSVAVARNALAEIVALGDQLLRKPLLTL